MFALPVPAQPVDATQALNFSAGVSNPRVLRGRSLSWRRGDRMSAPGKAGAILALLISQRLPAITIRERQWTGRKARRDRGLAAAPEFIKELGHTLPRMVFPYRSRRAHPRLGQRMAADCSNWDHYETAQNEDPHFTHRVAIVGRCR
jgi:hypothetical protein